MTCGQVFRCGAFQQVRKGGAVDKYVDFVDRFKRIVDWLWRNIFTGKYRRRWKVIGFCIIAFVYWLREVVAGIKKIIEVLY